MQRPFGVTLIAILSFLNGFLSLCWPLVGIFGSSLLMFLGPAGVAAGTIGILASLVWGAGGILSLIAAFGLWGLRPWGWWLAILGNGLTVAGVVIGLFTGAGWAAIGGSVLPIIIFVYLLLPDTRLCFWFWQLKRLV